MTSVNEVTSGLTGAWRIVKREESARECFDLSADGALRSFTGLVLSVPILFLTAAALWQIAQEELDITFEISFGAFLAVEVASTLIYWALFLLAMLRIARVLGLGANYTAYLITYNWGMLLTSAAFALPLIPYSLGLLPAGGAMLLSLPALGLLGWYRWQIARTVLGVEAGPAAAILIFDLLLSFSIDQLLATLFLTGGGLS
ncbi:MAG: hypothetical protein Q7V31_09365 [Parvibaculum sp.]|uniref:hypothetical protein n=1 Tax=Parvibaculum sp. TaxID=2024848 RepID=UPI00271E4503|nr:hypothetical protein [Parvibaculum sp.]MDO8839127.1 hypothetical protein [Parvibaculum sp.]